MAFKRSGKWGANLLGEEINEGSRAANARLMALTVRVADDEVREAISSMRDMLTNCQSAESKEKADITHRGVAEAYPLLMERIGKTLRNLY